MTTKSIKDRLKAAVSETDRFAAADQAMATGALVPLEPVKKLQASEKTVPVMETPSNKIVNAEFVGGARDTKKVPKGESVIIRETFSLPPEESSRIDKARQRSAVAGVMINRSEVIRAGIAALHRLDDKTFQEIVSSVPKLKTGRPS